MSEAKFVKVDRGAFNRGAREVYTFAPIRRAIEQIAEGAQKSANRSAIVVREHVRRSDSDRSE